MLNMELPSHSVSGLTADCIPDSLCAFGSDTWSTSQVTLLALQSVRVWFWDPDEQNWMSLVSVMFSLMHLLISRFSLSAISLCTCSRTADRTTPLRWWKVTEGAAFLTQNTKHTIYSWMSDSNLPTKSAVTPSVSKRMACLSCWLRAGMHSSDGTLPNLQRLSRGCTATRHSSKLWRVYSTMPVSLSLVPAALVLDSDVSVSFSVCSTGDSSRTSCFKGLTSSLPVSGWRFVLSPLSNSQSMSCEGPECDFSCAETWSACGVLCELCDCCCFWPSKRP